MGEEAALAHSHLVGEPAHREPADAFDRRKLGGGVEDRAVAPLAVAAALALRLSRDGLGALRGHAHIIDSTTGRAFMQYFARPVVLSGPRTGPTSSIQGRENK